MSDIETVEAQEVAQQPEPEITLTLKVSDVNMVLTSLDEMPHKMSRRIIDNIIQQAQSQIQQPAA
jgi:hypothetical protein